MAGPEELPGLNRVSGGKAQLARVGRALVGKSPRSLRFLLVPTLLAVAMDVILRGGTLLGYALQAKAIYGSSLLIGAALWALPLWCAARLFADLTPPTPLSLKGEGGDRIDKAERAAFSRAALLALSALWLFPFATFGFAGQALYHRVFHSYMGRDTLRLGIALRGTVADWFVAWGSFSLLGGIAAVGLVMTLGLLALMRREANTLGASVPWLLVLTFLGALGCLWFDQLDSRFLQAATPDACFVHGVVHALRMAVTGQWSTRKGVSIRAPSPLPPLAPNPARTPHVLVILTESVRADAICSDPPPRCVAPFLDAVVPDRVPLGLLTSQTPNTFSSFLVLTTGLAPNVDFVSAHSAPVLWELARAAGYRTAYVSAQNPKYEDFGTFVERAGIDVLVTGTDLGKMEQEQIGAPDERATEAMLGFLRANAPEGTAAPYFAVLHLSNTHAPYRVDPDLLPFQPSSQGGGLGGNEAFFNRYKNSARLQERTVAAFLKKVMGVPGWDDTVVLFLSDHGEQFHEHGGFFHNHSLYDEELRIPGWLVRGPHALSHDQRAALATYVGHRAYTQDVHATLVDLLGLYDVRGELPQAKLVGGRSLLRPRIAADEPSALLATSTAVWEPDDARYGVMRDGKVLVSSADKAWVCFDVAHDGAERNELPATACGELLGIAKGAFAGVDVPP